MRILFCSDALTIDGVTSYILNVGSALRRAGNDIAVIGRWAGKGFQSRYKSKGFTVISCPSFSVGNFYFDFRAKIFKPDVIMTDPRRSFPLATRIKKITNAPIITYFLDPVEKTDRPGRDLASLVKFSDIFTAFEPDILQQLKELNTNIPVMKMTRPLDIFFSPSELPDKKNFNLLCFGRLSRYKTPGIFHILDNIEKINARIPDCKINIVGGGGWRLYKLKLFARELNRKIGRDCVRIIGAQTDPSKFINDANVIFASATSAMEGAFSQRPVIAMCSGYFGRVTSESLDEAVKCYFSERYAKNDFANLLPDLFKIYDEYESESLRRDLCVISSRLKEKFSERETVNNFERIIMEQSRHIQEKKF